MEASTFDNDKLRLKDLKDVIPCEIRTIERLFKGLLGCSFREYYTRLKIEYAAHLLLNTELSIMDIAQKLFPVKKQ